jgi:hypothetical protein
LRQSDSALPIGFSRDWRLLEEEKAPALQLPRRPRERCGLNNSLPRFAADSQTIADLIGYGLKTAAQERSNPTSDENSAKIESVIVGIFDNDRDLDQADERLAAEGFEGTVYDEAIVAEEPSSVDPVGPVPVGSVLAPGAVPTEDLGSIESDSPTIARAFKSSLADCHLPDDVNEAYATAFYHKGKFVIVRTEPECDKHVMKILRECGATRVDQSDLNTVVWTTRS